MVNIICQTSTKKKRFFWRLGEGMRVGGGFGRDLFFFFLFFFEEKKYQTSLSTTK